MGPRRGVHGHVLAVAQGRHARARRHLIRSLRGDRAGKDDMPLVDQGRNRAETLGLGPFRRRPPGVDGGRRNRGA